MPRLASLWNCWRETAAKRLLMPATPEMRSFDVPETVTGQLRASGKMNRASVARPASPP